MKALGQNFSLPVNLVTEVDAYRARKIGRLEGVLSRLPGMGNYPWAGLAADHLPLRYALTHHIFETVSRAAADGDTARVAEALRLRSDQSILRPVSGMSGPVFVAHPDKELFTEDAALAEAPVALVNRAVCDSADDDDRNLVLRAIATAAEAGFGSTIARNCRVVVLIALRVPTDICRSWTTTALPATVHLDYFAEHYYVSRDLIHESAHTELNDLFATLDITFPDDTFYYAPWLQVDRPVFGFLHGAWAFSHVALYSAWLANAQAPPEVQALSWAIYLKHAEQIQQAHDDIERALDLVPHPQLAELILSYRDRVLDGYTVAHAVGESGAAHPFKEVNG